MKKIINLTPHDVNIVSEDKIITIEAFKIVARCAQINQRIGEIETNKGSIPLSRTQFGEVENLPEQDEDVLYIVSRLVKDACPERPDLLVPNEIVRDETGRIVGCESLAES